MTNSMEKLSTLGFGCVSLFSIPFYKVNSLLNTAFDLGIRHYDTAPIYSNGFSEKILGNFARNKRSEITITTKFGLSNSNDINLPIPIANSLNSLKKILNRTPYQRKSLEINNIKDLLNYRRIDKISIEKNLSDSLRNLKTDYIDYYLLHEGLPNFLTEDALSFLAESVKKGLILNLGLATNANNILSLKELDTNFWKAIQYNSPLGHSEIDLNTNFNEAIHLQHSIFNDVNIPDEIQSNGELYGYQLALASKNNPKGKVLFATTQEKHLIQNIKTYLKYRS